MKMSFHRIAYEALDVCNAVSMSVVDELAAQTGLRPGDRAIDIGCGNGAVSIRLTDRFGLTVEAVEMDPAMAELARERTRDHDGLNVHEAPAGPLLRRGAPWDFVVCLGATDPSNEGLREPSEMMAAVGQALRPGGWLLWGDLVWLSEPSVPLRQIVEMSGLYTDHDGWQAAAHAAGLEVVRAELSDQATWDAYVDRMLSAVSDWLTHHPDHADAAAVAARANQMRMMLDFGRGVMGFGLYLLRKPI
jgi:SAM-dependent methyltransferase